MWPITSHFPHRVSEDELYWKHFLQRHALAGAWHRGMGKGKGEGLTQEYRYGGDTGVRLALGGCQ